MRIIGIETGSVFRTSGNRLEEVLYLVKLGKKEFMMMILLIFCCLGMGSVFGNVLTIHHQTFPVVRDFEFRGGLVLGSGESKRSTSEVVVNNISLSDEELIQMVLDEYLLMNGPCESVQFNLYYSVRALHKNDPYMTKTFNFEK